MTEGVLDDPEAVEVEEEDGQALAAPAGLGHGLAQAIEKELPVRQAGERVAIGERVAHPQEVEGHVLDLLDRALAEGVDRSFSREAPGRDLVGRCVQGLERPGHPGGET
jgi:hypothetical protein